ncbi:MAG: nucleotide exchange factor GrpE, partial [Octadecabacter sp.]
MAENDNENQFLDDIMADPLGGPEDEMTLDEMAAEDDSTVALKTEISELKDAYMRALADVENSRKRADRDRREAENYGGSRLARDLLPVYDNLERA